ncbi:MAG: OB-fold domain-containing protein [Rhizobiaceae bacterium]|nr:OB-fold domain-containing protein [Rhizobiaceae bacterium]
MASERSVEAMHLLDPNIVRVPEEGSAGPCLLGARCRGCGNVVFPRMPVCPACLRDDAMEEVEIGRSAVLYSHTIARFAPAGFKAPYFQGFVDLPEGPRIFTLIGSGCRVEPGVLHDGMAMRLVVEPLADTPENGSVLTYKYVPDAGAEGQVSHA